MSVASDHRLRAVAWVTTCLERGSAAAAAADLAKAIAAYGMAEQEIGQELRQLVRAARDQGMDWETIEALRWGVGPKNVVEVS